MTDDTFKPLKTPSSIYTDKAGLCTIRLSKPRSVSLEGIEEILVSRQSFFEPVSVRYAPSKSNQSEPILAKNDAWQRISPTFEVCVVLMIYFGYLLRF